MRKIKFLVWLYIIRPMTKAKWWVRDNITHRAAGKAHKEAVHKEVPEGGIVIEEEEG